MARPPGLTRMEHALSKCTKLLFMATRCKLRRNTLCNTRELYMEIIKTLLHFHCPHREKSLPPENNHPKGKHLEQQQKVPGLKLFFRCPGLPSFLQFIWHRFAVEERRIVVGWMSASTTRYDTMPIRAVQSLFSK